MTIEERTIEFLESQISTNFKELCDIYLIESVEWMEDHAKDELRPYARLSESNKRLDIIILFPPLNKSQIT